LINYFAHTANERIMYQNPFFFSR